MNELSKDLEFTMIPEGLYRDIALAIGIDNLVKLSDLIGGSTFYLPKSESLVKPVRDARIKAEFNGYNHMELARRYDVTERWIRTLCGDGHVIGQMDLFSFLNEHDEGRET